MTNEAQKISKQAINEIKDEIPLDEVLQWIESTIRDSEDGELTLREVITIIVLTEKLVGAVVKLVDGLKDLGRKLFGW